MDNLLAQIKAVAVAAEYLLVNEARFQRNDNKQTSLLARDAAATKASDFSSLAMRGDTTGALTPAINRLAMPLAAIKQDLVEKNEAPLSFLANIRQEEIMWLATCTFAEVRHISLVSKLERLLQGAGVANCFVKYIGSLRVLLECAMLETVEKLALAGENQL